MVTRQEYLNKITAKLAWIKTEPSVTVGDREKRLQTALAKVNINHGETLKKLGE